MRGNNIEELEDVIIDLTETEDARARTVDEFISQSCTELVKGLCGDLNSLMHFADVLDNNNSYLRSLVVSLLTGKTMFDSLNFDDYDECDKRVKSQNLLIRELYRLLEKGFTETDFNIGKCEEEFIEKMF